MSYLTEKVYDIGQEIKRLRSEHKLTHKEVADRSGLAGSHISMIERGVRKPTAETLIALANGLDVSCIYLFIKAGWVTEVQVTSYAKQIMRS